MRYCNTTYMTKNEERRPKKLNYILVSNRWKSMVAEKCRNKVGAVTTPLWPEV